MGIFGKKDTGIFQRLKDEHREVNSLLDQIEALGGEDMQEAKDIFAVMQEKLLAHAKGEEMVVYPRFGQIESLHELVLEAKEEHQIVEDLLAKLNADELEDNEWMAALKVLKEQIQHHVKEEEGEIFPRAKDEIEARESEQLATVYLESKGEATEEEPGESLESLSKADLLVKARELGIESYSRMTKAELIQILSVRR